MYLCVCVCACLCIRVSMYLCMCLCVCVKEGSVGCVLLEASLRNKNPIPSIWRKNIHTHGHGHGCS